MDSNCTNMNSCWDSSDKEFLTRRAPPYLTREKQSQKTAWFRVCSMECPKCLNVTVLVPCRQEQTKGRLQKQACCCCTHKWSLLRHSWCLTSVCSKSYRTMRTRCPMGSLCIKYNKFCFIAKLNLTIKFSRFTQFIKDNFVQRMHLGEELLRKANFLRPVELSHWHVPKPDFIQPWLLQTYLFARTLVPQGIPIMQKNWSLWKIHKNSRCDISEMFNEVVFLQLDQLEIS